MKEFKGTPNGWKLRNERHEVVKYVKGGVNHTIYKADIQAELTNRHITEIRGASQFENELKANAAIIAAAPELLQALQKAVDDYGKPGGPWNVPSEPGTWIYIAKEAINKALNI